MYIPDVDLESSRLQVGWVVELDPSQQLTEGERTLAAALAIGQQAMVGVIHCLGRVVTADNPKIGEDTEIIAPPPLSNGRWSLVIAPSLPPGGMGRIREAYGKGHRAMFGSSPKAMAKNFGVSTEVVRALYEGFHPVPERAAPNALWVPQYYRPRAANQSLDQDASHKKRS